MEFLLHQVCIFFYPLFSSSKDSVIFFGALFLLFSYSLPWSVLPQDQEARGAWSPRCPGVTQVIFPLPPVEHAWHVPCTVCGGASVASSTRNTSRQSPEAVPPYAVAEHYMGKAICFI
ncbi:hypothetical protein PAHAL_9G331800 [Panicum hallii]|uniref:Uncharacterized protein n=1 Tax=Panicum hallii TaxID=206008 RepID=A0A2S3IMP9_9POAL|nr:hypothetical protein PAHAL_9G331800 [Panicum hallii]